MARALPPSICRSASLRLALCLPSGFSGACQGHGSGHRIFAAFLRPVCGFGLVIHVVWTVLVVQTLALTSFNRLPLGHALPARTRTWTLIGLSVKRRWGERRVSGQFGLERRRSDLLPLVQNGRQGHTWRIGSRNWDINVLQVGGRAPLI